MNLAKFQAVHAAVGNAPSIISVMATEPVNAGRYFYGTGAPGAGTLATGNGKYNGASSGYVISVVLFNAGSGYSVGDILTTSGGIGTAAQITVDAVSTSGGATNVITDWHVSTVGAYSVYPTGTVTVTGGTGSGAAFRLNVPAPDFYLDITSLTAPVLYVCTINGSNAGSTWARISGAGGGGYMGTYSNGSAYSAGDIVRVESAVLYGTVTSTIGVFGCINSVPASGTANQIPQFPEPASGMVYWQLIAFGVQEIGVCTGTSQNAYINASNSF